MVCRRCNTPLGAGAHFCPHCGSSVTWSHDAPASPGPPQQAVVPSPLVQPTAQERVPRTPLQAVPSQQATSAPSSWATPPRLQAVTQPASPQPQMSPLQGPSPLSYYQPQNMGAKMPPAVVNTQTSSPSRRRGCTLGCLTVLLLLLLIVAGWFFVARPFLHDIAVTQLDRAMSSAVNQISPVEAGVLPHILIVNENTLTNMLV